MESQLKKLKDKAFAELKKIASAQELQRLETKYLGRKGELTQVLKNLKNLAEAEKPKLGALANQVKAEIGGVISQIREEVKAGQNASSGQSAALDITLPGFKKPIGHLHPITLITRQLADIFAAMGFIVWEGPEAESDYYNFQALNIPESHPARDMQDTFYIKNHAGWVMRTHTSNQQARALERFGAPLRAIFPGRVFRSEATDASHEAVFYQLEGLMVDKNISVANLIAVMKSLLKEVFKREVKIRLRPGYFPFVEPGFELDMNCLICGGTGCKVCKNSGWVETMPCGLVHPRVLEYGGLDPKEYSGFAFGLGLSRLAMMKYSIPDIRLFLSGDIRFLEQF